MKRKIARGKVRQLLVLLGRLQCLSGRARSLYLDDRDPNTADKIIPVFDEMFDICITALGEYEQISEKRSQKGGDA